MVGSVTASVLVGGREVWNLRKNAMLAEAERAVKVILRGIWIDEMNMGLRSEMLGDGQQDPEDGGGTRTAFRYCTIK